MIKPHIEYLKELNIRLHARGFSWQHEDYLNLQEILPEILQVISEAEELK